MQEPLAIRATGMVTGVGLDARSSCAAIRCGITGFAETRFHDDAHVWIRGAEVRLPEAWRGRDRLLRLAAMSVSECLTAAAWPRSEPVPLLLIVAEEGRPGRPAGLDRSLLEALAPMLPAPPTRTSEVLARGRAGIGAALETAARRIAEGEWRDVVIAGVDSLLNARTLAALEARWRLLTSAHSDGFLPGEAGAAVLVAGSAARSGDAVWCNGLGFGREKATIESGDPLRGDGMTQAFRGAIESAGIGMGAVDFHIADHSGGSYGFKEASLALSRVLRERKEFIDIWHPGDCIGEVGAAIGPCVLGVAWTAASKGYAPGSTALCHFSGDDGDRFAAVVSTRPKGAA